MRRKRIKDTKRRHEAERYMRKLKQNVLRHLVYIVDLHPETMNIVTVKPVSDEEDEENRRLVSAYRLPLTAVETYGVGKEGM